VDERRDEQLPSLEVLLVLLLRVALGTSWVSGFGFRVSGFGCQVLVLSGFRV